MAYRILKNAGYVPEEVAIQREINQIEDFLGQCRDEKKRLESLKRMDVLRIRMEQRTGKRMNLRPDSDYFTRVVERIGNRQKGK
jgi:hypothetical protein